MNWLEAQFQNSSFNDPLFLPEYEAAKSISVIVSVKKLTPTNVKEVVEIFNKTNEVPHKGGLGWKDLRLHIGTLIRKHKMSYKITPEGNLEIQEEEAE